MNGDILRTHKSTGQRGEHDELRHFGNFEVAITYLGRWGEHDKWQHFGKGPKSLAEQMWEHQDTDILLTARAQERLVYL